MAAFSFNPTQVAPAQPREARTAGWYPAKGITESEVVATQSGGQMLKITVELQDGGFVWNNFNIANQNQEVVQRAYQDIAALCQAIGINHQVNDTRELHSRPFDVKLRVEKQDGYDDKNVIASGGFAVLGAKADKYIRAAEPPRGAPFQPGSGHGAQFAGSPSAGFAQVAPVAPQQFAPAQTVYQPQPQAVAPAQFTPPAPIQQPMPQAPQQFAPQQAFQQAATPQQFQQQQPQFQQHPAAPSWTQPR